MQRRYPADINIRAHTKNMCLLAIFLPYERPSEQIMMLSFSFPEAKKAGIAEHTLHRAKKQIGVKSWREGFAYGPGRGQWVWGF